MLGVTASGLMEKSTSSLRAGTAILNRLRSYTTGLQNARLEIALQVEVVDAEEKIGGKFCSADRA
jgi:hypothetical protein